MLSLPKSTLPFIATVGESRSAITVTVGESRSTVLGSGLGQTQQIDTNGLSHGVHLTKPKETKP